LLMVKYSIEQGVFGPGVRIAMGCILAAGLVGLGEWFRRSKSSFALDGVPTAHIPSILTAVGTTAAFANIYAAHALYGFIGPATAFILLGAVGIATMFAAALHGPALAGLGLIGAFVTPALVASSTPAPWPLVLYLAVIAASAYALARLRQWLWLAAAAVGGAVIWGALMILSNGGPGLWNTPLQAHALIQCALAAAFMAIEPHLGTSDSDAKPDRIAELSLFALTGLIVVTMAATRAGDSGWMLFGTLSIALLAATGLKAVPAASAAIFAGVATLAMAFVWPDLRAPVDTRFLWPAVGDLIRVPDLQKGYLTYLAVATTALSSTVIWRLLQGRTLPHFAVARYALAAVVTPLAVLIATYLRVTQFDSSIWFAGFAVLLAGLLYLAADRFDNLPADQKNAGSHLALGSFAAGTMAAATLAFVFALDRGYLTAAFAITALTTSIFAVVDKIPSLRYCVAALGLLVLGRIVWDPRIMGAGVGTWPIFNWLLIGYGVPAAAFLAAGHTLKRDKDDLASQLSDALGVLFAGLLVFFQIRHALNGGDPLARTSGHIEMGLFALMSIGFAYVLNRIELRRRNPIFGTAVMIFGGLAALTTFAGLLLIENPFFSHDLVRGPAVFSSLMLAYLLPGLAAVVLARSARTHGQAWMMRLAAVLALVLIFAYATLETRHAFQGADIYWWNRTSSPEMWAYSLVWLVLGILCLAYGVVRGSFEARIASGLLVLLAILKAFLYDLSVLTGIWRPLSFLCLGAVLIGIGLVYQRFVFAPPPAKVTT
jgi:uncharacterized membrane protein